MAHYHFVTEWLLETDAEKAWDVLKGNRYGDWWDGVKVDVLQQGDENGIGEVRKSTFKTKLPYALSFTNRLSKLERPSYIELEAYGELEGTGRYELTQDGQVTKIVYTWDVRTTKAWMNVVGPIMKPLFVWNHDQVMHQGAVGLAKQLNARLIKG